MKHFGSYRGDCVANTKIRHRDNLTVYLIKKREKIVKRSAYRFTSTMRRLGHTYERASYVWRVLLGAGDTEDEQEAGGTK